MFPGQQGGPLEHVIAAKAVSFKVAAEPEFVVRQQLTLDGAKILADRLLQPDSRAAGLSVVSGGTDVHLVLVDLRDSELDGKQAEDRLHRVGITVNRNAVPFDPRPPMVSSGVRIGTSALATRGFDLEAFAEVADVISHALRPEHRRRRARGPAQSCRRPGVALPALPQPRRSRAVTTQTVPPGAHLPDHPEFLWRTPAPKKTYDVVIVGGGGHGLATAHYLAKNHGITNVAVLERGWLAGGNMARNTTLIRSNYLWDESTRIYEHALKLWEGLEDDLDYPILFKQCGVLNLAHSLQDVRDSVRRVEANKLNGVDAHWVDPDEVKKLCPIVNVSNDIRYPVMGATYQPRAGIAKHDYVAWGFARRADQAGIDIIQNCEVTGFVTDGDRVTGVRTTQGDIGAGQVALCAAGHTSTLTDMLGIRTPLQSHPLQALVSELLEPVHPTIVMSNAVHVYVSQAHKGELVMGAGVDSYNGYGQRGAFHIIERQMAAAVELFPVFARAHLLRTWAGIVDVCPDASPIVGRTPYENLYLNAGWGTGGFKATPGIGWCLADTIANDEPHEFIAPFSLDRFVSGALVDEHGAAGVAH